MASSPDAPVAKPAVPVTKQPRKEQYRRFIPANVQIMTDTLNTFRKDDILTDLTLKSSGKSFPCHKVILASASEYFKMALTSGFKESQSGEIEFPNIHPEILHVILEYIYGQVVTLEAANAMDLHSASHLLQIKGLIKATKNFMLTNFRECYGHQSFLAFPLPHLIEYISDSRLEVRNEDEVYKSVVRWITHDLPQRENATADLMAHVRAPFCTQSFMCQVIINKLINRSIALNPVPSSTLTTQIKAREGSMTMGLEEHSVIKYISTEEGVLLSSQSENHEYSLKILAELPHIDMVSGYRVCASETTVVITGGIIDLDETIDDQPAFVGGFVGGFGGGFGSNSQSRRPSANRTRNSTIQQHTWRLNTIHRTWSQMPKLPHGSCDHSSIIMTDGTIFTQSNNDILMLKPEAKQWEVLLQQNSLQVVDGNSEYLLMIDANQDYYLFHRGRKELIKLNMPNTSCLLKFINEKLLALCKGIDQFRSFSWFNFTKKVWKPAGWVQAQCDGVDENSKACVWKGNLILTYPGGLAIFNPDTAILRHFVSCEIDSYDACNIFPIFVSERDWFYSNYLKDSVTQDIIENIK